jgi:hypothetical protein
MAIRKKLSREEIHALRGKFKLKTGDKPFAEEWAEYKRKEKELEERKFQRLAALGKNQKCGACHRRPGIQGAGKGNQNQLACEISGWQDQTNSPAQPDNLK